MRTSKIEIYRDEPLIWITGRKQGGWRWRLRASNGRIVSQSSEGYNDPRDLVRGLEITWPGSELVCYDDGTWGLDNRFSLGADIRVEVPEGTGNLWRARVKR